MYKSKNKYDHSDNQAGPGIRPYMLFIGILLTGLGTVLFFPLDINGKYTCFFHWVFDHSHPVSLVSEEDIKHVHSNEISEVGEKTPAHAGGIDMSKKGNKVNDTRHGSVLLERYLNLYAFIWWTCTGLLALSIFTWLKTGKKI